MSGYEPIRNPECREDKHPNCDGTGWDLRDDKPAACPCGCHEVKP